MQNYIVHIKSKLPALVNVGSFGKLLENIEDSLDLKYTGSEKLLIRLNPTVMEYQNAKTLPYTIEVNLQDLSKNNFNLIQLTVYPAGHIEILLMQNSLISASAAPQKITVGKSGYYIKVSGSDNSLLLIEADDLYFQKQLSLPIINLNARVIGDYIIIEARQTKGSSLLILKYDNGFFEEAYHQIDSLDFKEGEILALKHLNDIAKQGFLFSYKIEKNNLTCNHKVVYLNERPVLVNDARIIPFAFIEAAKVKNYNLCRYYMGDALKSKLSNAHLNSFFEGVVHAAQNLYNAQEGGIALIYKNDFIYKAKYFEFEIQNNKITNIIEL